MLSHRPRGDDGSLLLAMLALLVVTGLVIVTAASVIAGQQQTRFDNRFENALQVAEHGMDQMVALLQAAPGSSTAPTLGPGTTPGGGRWSVNAVNDPTRRVWTVTACGWKDLDTAPAPACDGRPGPDKRAVQVQVKYPSAFPLAAFGRIATTLNGSNLADSFTSTGDNPVPICFRGTTTAVPDPSDPSATDVWPCNGRTGRGAVGTNGGLFLKGDVAAEVDRMDIANAKAPNVEDPVPGAAGECLGAALTCAMTSKLFYQREPIAVPGTGVCDGAGTPRPYTGQINPLGGRIYRFTDVTLTSATQFTGSAQPGAQPTIICMTGNLTVPNGALVNFSAPVGSTPAMPRPPGTLYIINTGTGGASVSIGNHASVSAALLAPSALVQLNSSGNFYGSIVANEIASTGNFRFHYDDNLAASLLSAPVIVSDWYELR